MVLVRRRCGIGFKPLNWMTPPVVLEDGGDLLVVRKRAGRSEDRLEIRLLEVLSDVEHEMGEAAALEKDGVERDLQLALAAAPEAIADGLRLVQREWPTDIGPVDLMCRDEADEWVAVEIKRVGTIDAVEQLSRYLEFLISPRSREGRLRGHPRGAAVQAASGDPRRSPRHPLCRGRPRSSSRRARARADPLHRVAAATLWAFAGLQ